MLDDLAQVHEKLCADRPDVSLVGYPTRIDADCVEVKLLCPHEYKARMTPNTWCDAVGHITRQKRLDTKVRSICKQILEQNDSRAFPWIDTDQAARDLPVLDGWLGLQEALEKMTAARLVQWPFVVTRRSPVIMWQEGAVRKCLV